MTPVQRRRWALGALVLVLLGAGTALQPPPNVGPRQCRSDLKPGTVTRNGKPTLGCVLHADGRSIFVSHFRKGPKRGSIVSLAEARRRYGGVCTDVAGRDYVVVGDGKPDEPIEGSNGSERMIGLDGDSVIDAGVGDDCIDGRAGNDKLVGGGGNDVIFGGPGNDSLTGSGGDDSIHGGDGNDSILGGAGGDHLFGGPGNDRIGAGGGADVVSAGPGDDVINAPKPGLLSVNCGPGRDQVTVNEINQNRVHNCEVVRVVTG
jgi:Ca2+-binding RTX toxin-like protein